MAFPFKQFKQDRGGRNVGSRQDFVYLWIAHGVSNLGSRITREALPLTAILMLGGSTAQMGVLAALNLAPGLLAGFFAGHWIDYLRKRPLMVVMDCTRAIILLTVPLAAMLHVLHLEQLYAVAFLMGTLSALFEIADQSYLPILVERRQLTHANSKLAATTAVAEASGPALNGALVQWLTAPVAIVFDAASYLLSAWSLSRIRHCETVPQSRHTQPLWHGVRAGFAASFADPTVRAIFIADAMIALFAPMFVPVYAYYAIRELSLTPLMLGVAISCGGVGALIGATIAPAITRMFGVTRALVAGLAMLGAAQLLVPLAHGSSHTAAVWLAVAQFVGDGFFVLFLVNELSVRQQLIAPHLLARANASLRMTTGALSSVGILLAGTLAEILGARALLWISVSGIIFTGALFTALLAPPPAPAMQGRL